MTLQAIVLLLIQSSLAPPAVSTPTLGYALDHQRLIRFRGVPGACHAVLETEDTNYTKLVSASHAPVTLLVPDTNTPTLIYRTDRRDTSVPIPERPLMLSLSPTGTYFAVLSPSHLWLYHRSERTPVVTIALSTLSLDASSVTGLAVADSGDLLATTVNALWYASTAGSPLTLQPIRITQARFAPRDHLIVAYDPTEQRIIALHPTAAFAIEPLVGPDDGLTAVTGLEFARDGSSIWISQQSGILLNYALTARQLTTFPASPGSLTSVLAPGVYIWSQPDQQRAVLDTTRSSPTVLLVPSDPGEASR